MCLGHRTHLFKNFSVCLLQQKNVRRFVQGLHEQQPHKLTTGEEGWNMLLNSLVHGTPRHAWILSHHAIWHNV